MKYCWIAVIVSGAAAARLWLLFSTELVPGINGAYYLIQVRALLERQELALPDLPLVFYFEALLAGLLQRLTGNGINESVLLAVKLIDGILPAFAALPIFFLLERWSLNTMAPRWISALGALLVVMCFPALSVVGDLQKHSLALALLAALLWQINAWMKRPSAAHLLGIGLSGALIALTHIAVFGATMLLLAGIFLASLFVRKRFPWKAQHPLVVAAIVVLVMIVGAVWWRFDAQRLYRLFSVVSNLANLTQNGAFMPGATGVPSPITSYLLWFFELLAAFGIVSIIWRKRQQLPVEVISIVTGATLSILALTMPLFSQDMALRLALITVLPGILVLCFAMQQISNRWLRNILALGVALVLLLPSGSFVVNGGQAMLSSAAMQELKSLSALVHSPAKTLIIAPHGLEWWTAWTLGTKISNPDAVEISDCRNYAEVFVIEQKQWFLHRMPPPPLIRSARTIPAVSEIVHDGKYFKLIRADIAHNLTQQGKE